MKNLLRYNKIATILASLILVLCFAACSQEDDVEEIFEGHRFKITGLTYNGTKVVKDVSQFYASDAIYWVVFNANTFQGVLQEGGNISGQWAADGKNQTLRLTFNANSSTGDNELSRMVADVLRNARKYRGDKNVLRIHKDDKSFVELNSLNK